jgi:tripartite-type tricarboxylate transporter receptor subunit TctC
LSLLLPATASLAQDWPQPRAVRIVVPFTPGSATDVVSRAVFVGLRAAVREMKDAMKDAMKHATKA